MMNTVWIYDTAVFPFHRAEEYHQFHDVNTLDAYARTRPACVSARMCFVCLCLSFLCGCKPVLTIKPPLHNIPYSPLWIFDFSLFSSYSLKFACVWFLHLFRGLQR